MLLLAQTIAVLALASTSVVLATHLALHLAARRAPSAPCRERRDGDPAGWLRSTIREAVSSLRAALACARPVPPPSGPGSTVVVLVHGFGSSPATVSVLGRRLRRAGWPVSVPHLGRWWRDVADAAERLARHVDHVRRTYHYSEVVLVAHGVGGLAARRLLQPGGRDIGVRRLVTLGTPHGGTTACPWLRIGPYRDDVRPGSGLLRALATPLPPFTEAIAIASPDDVLIRPAHLAGWREACNISVQHSGHLDVVFSSRVFELIAENLPPAHRRAG